MRPLPDVPDPLVEASSSSFPKSRRRVTEADEAEDTAEPKSPRTDDDARRRRPRPKQPDPLKLYVREIGDGPPLTPQKSGSRSAQGRGDEEAKKKLIESNLRLVMSITRTTRGRRAASDLIQEGNPTDSRRGEVRLQARLQADLRNPVDPPGSDARLPTGRTIRLFVHVADQVRRLMRAPSTRPEVQPRAHREGAREGSGFPEKAARSGRGSRQPETPAATRACTPT